MARKHQIYALKNGAQIGPFTKRDLTAKIASGEIAADDLVWHDKLTDWQKAEDAFPEIFDRIDRRQELEEEKRLREMEPATEPQLDYLRNLEVTIPLGLTKRNASALIDAAVRRQNPVTDNQKRRLFFYKIPIIPGMTKQEASDLIDEHIAAHPESEAAYQAWKKEAAGASSGCLGLLRVILICVLVIIILRLLV